MAFTHSSAGVYLEEYDRSFPAAFPQYVTTGAIVGESDKGAVEVPTYITSIDELVDHIGIPNPKKSFMFYEAAAFIKKGGRLYIVRVNDGANCSGMVLYCRDTSGGVWTSWGIETKPFSDDAVLLPANVALTNPMIQYSFSDTEELMMFCSTDPGEWGNDIVVEVKDITFRDTSEFTVNIYYGDSTVPIESYNVTLHDSIDGFGQQTQVEEVINSRSKKVRVKVNKNHALYVSPPENKIIINAVLPPQNCDYGINGGFPNNAARTSAIIGGVLPDGSSTGWEIFSDPELIDVKILINGGYVDPAIQRRIATMAKNRNSFAVIDMPRLYQGANSSIRSEVDFRRNVLNVDNCYAAICTPDIYIYDQYNNIHLYVPLSGYVAGNLVRNDSFYGPWYPPSGVLYGLIEDAKGVYVRYNQEDRDIMEDHQVNCAISIRGVGIVLFGDSTLQSMKSAVSGMGPRRLMSEIENRLSASCLRLVYSTAASSVKLRQELIDIVDAIIAPIKASEGVYWYGAVCDDSNNGREIYANGDVILDVFVQPTITAKRIHLNAIMAKSGEVAYSLGLV